MKLKKIMKLGWLSMPFIFAALCTSQPVYSDNSDSTTTQFRQTYLNGSSVEIQTYNLSSKNGGMVTIGPGTATDGTTRLDLAPGLTGTSSMRLEQGVAPTTPVEGDKWNDSTSKSFIHYSDGLKTYDAGIICISTGPGSLTGTGVSTVTTGATLYGTNVLPANYLVVGKSIRFKVMGTINTLVGSAGTLTVNVALGTTVIAGSGAFTPSPGVSSRTFMLDGIITCASSGASGSAIGQFELMYSSNTNPGNMFIVEGATGTVTPLNTTVSQALNITVQWNTGGNNFIPTNIVYEDLN